MNVENAPLAIGSMQIDPVMLALGVGIAAVAVLAAQKAPRLFTLLAVVGALAGGALLIH